MPLQWFECEASPYNLRKFAGHAGRTGIHVSSGARTAFHGVDGVEIGSLKKIASDLSITLIQTGEPIYHVAPCGKNVTSLNRHAGQCKSCQTLGGALDKNNVPKGSKTIVKVKGLQHFSLDGMLSVLKEELAMAQLLVTEYSAIIHAIEEFPNVEKELDEAKQRLENNRQAIAFFSSDTHRLDIDIKAEENRTS